jgi:hypothetical protein
VLVHPGPAPAHHLTPTPDVLLEGELLCKEQAELTFRIFAGPYVSFVSNETRMPSSMTLLTRRSNFFIIVIIIYPVCGLARQIGICIMHPVVTTTHQPDRLLREETLGSGYLGHFILNEQLKDKLLKI